MDPSREKVVIVDRENNEIGSVSRAEMRAKGLAHRATYILVFNSLGELFIQKRTPIKDIYPGYYDVAAGGVVQAGETYEESAGRELFEELGIQCDTLSSHFDYYYEDGANKVWGRIFSCVHDGSMVLQKEEVEIGMFIRPEKIPAMNEQEPFTPDGLRILRRYLSEKSNSV